MTTATLPRTSRLTFGGILKSEFIKLFTLRSTFWCILIVVVLSVGIGLIIATVNPPARAGVPAAGPLTVAAQQADAVSYATAGSQIGELVLAVLGALVITGEYGTGMIRSTLAAVPKRLPALIAKALVLAITAFVVGVVSIFGTAAIIFPLLPGTKKIHPDWTDWHVLESLMGGALYLVLVALIAFSIGAIIRNSAGGIAAALGLILVLPGLVGLIGGLTQITWIENIANFLPSAVGGNLSHYTGTKTQVVSGIISLDRLDSGLVLLAWFVVLFVVAAVLLKRRDA
ncbi:MAG: type transport system permease protein [Actinomycetota bacterium]|jgi:ABC-2 type transport system permease protein|nr:type transport system permease protein [Actinomycetota bacterium]